MTNSFDVIFVGVGFVRLAAFLGWAFREWFIVKKLKQLGISTEATVAVLGKNQWTRNLNYYVVCRFYINNNSQETMTRQQTIGWNHYNRLKIGNQITIRYLPNKPTIARLSGSDTDNTSRDMSLLTALIIIITLIISFEKKKVEILNLVVNSKGIGLVDFHHFFLTLCCPA
ncbi:MAG: DUF3592 domain-containing protein [Chloroflexota bacterium]